MMNRGEEDLEFECDFCGESEFFDKYTNFSACWEELKYHGWRCFKEDMDWKHKCPACIANPEALL